MKKETLEEAKLRIIDSNYVTVNDGDIFEMGAKWQAERMYSEEDFKLFARQYYREARLNTSNLLWDDLADKCLKQFKKK